MDHLGILVDPALMASRCAECNADKFRLASAEEVSSELHASTIERYSVPLQRIWERTQERLLETDSANETKYYESYYE